MNVKFYTMKLIQVLILIMLFLVNGIVHGQLDSNPRIEKKHGVVLSGGGPGLYGALSYDYFVSPNVDVEIGAGPFTVFAGVKYHFEGGELKKWTPYIGGYSMYIWIFEILTDDDNDTPQGWYFPAGIQYIGDKGFSFAIELAVMHAVGDSIGFGSVKVGYRF